MHASTFDPSISPNVPAAAAMLTQVAGRRSASRSGAGYIEFIAGRWLPLLLLAALAVAGPAKATIYTVGTGGDCTHGSFTSALNAAVADVSPGPHQIRIASSSIHLANQDYQIIDPPQDITITGGFASCADSVPASGGRTELHMPHAGRRVLRVSNNNANPRRIIRLQRLTLSGGQNPTAGFSGGGGILVTGRASVRLLDATYVQDNEAGNGGGIVLFNLTTNPDQFTDLLIAGNSRVCGNEASGPGSAGNGGGVYALGGTVVRMWSGRICDNVARRHGGGLFLLGGSDTLELDPWEGDLVEFTGNQAGGATYSATLGQGGAIHAGAGATIRYETGNTPATEYSLLFSGNIANSGGAIHVEGGSAPDASFASIELRNAALLSNESRGRGGALVLRNAVDLRLVKFGPGRCQFFGPQPCVLAAGNSAANTSFSPSLGGGGFAFLEHDAGAQRPALRVAGALFANNVDEAGTAAVIDARGNSSVRLLRNVFIGNEALGTESLRALVESRADVLFGYNTVLNNAVSRMLWLSSGNEVNATGSILYAPGVNLLGGAGTLVHNGCLNAHTTSGIPAAGVVTVPPRLGAGHAPRGGSPAIDACATGLGDNFWPSAWDGYGEPTPVDVASVPNIGGAWDLGAIEQRDIIMYGGFGQRPGN